MIDIIYPVPISYGIILILITYERKHENSLIMLEWGWDQSIKLSEIWASDFVLLITVVQITKFNHKC